jgi:hypothetical protein
MSTYTLTEQQHIILKFREMVAGRYRYEDLKMRFPLPPAIEPAVIADVEMYFLECLYPAPEDREGLENAFLHLGRYVRQPQKIFGIFGNLAGAIFKFGRHFLQALKAAFGALDAFLGAKKFEQEMVIIANRKGIVPPLSDEDFEDCMADINRQAFEQFIDQVVSLFSLMMHTELRRKTISILDDVIETMKRKPHLYPPHDIEGITLGRFLLVRGDQIFSRYDDQTRKQILEIVSKNEHWYLSKVYG